jgi:hypothetical protein
MQMSDINDEEGHFFLVLNSDLKIAAGNHKDLSRLSHTSPISVNRERAGKKKN